MRILAKMSGIFCIGLQPGRLQHIGKADAGPFGVPNCAIGPLIAACRRIEAGAAVTAAFDQKFPRDDLETLFQIADRQLERFVDLTVDCQCPGIRRCRLRDGTVIADKMTGCRRYIVIQQMRRSLCIDGAVAEDG